MLDNSKEARLTRWTEELEKDFARWEYLKENGGADPFHSDGVNLNLVRNHIIDDKRRIEELVNDKTEQISFISVSLPDIYFKETPPVVPYNYMAKADEIRAHAKEQLDLYEQDPNFQYCIENHSKVFPAGETKATKAAGLSPGKTGGLTRFRSVVESDDLVAIRSYFSEPYESKAQRWAEGAQQLKAFLEAEHDPKDDVVIPEEYEEADISEESMDSEEIVTQTAVKKPSLDEQITKASNRISKQEPNREHREEQMSLF